MILRNKLFVLPPPKSTTPKDPDPKKTEFPTAGTFDATALTGVAGGGILGIIAGLICLGINSWDSFTGLSRPFELVKSICISFGFWLPRAYWGIASEKKIIKAFYII